MNVILIGTIGERARLRAQAAGTNLTVVAEAATQAEARHLDIVADALLVPVSHDHVDAGAFHEDLTPRELEVLDLLAHGLSNRAIAERLGISDQTVKFHVAALSGKLGAANRTSAVRLGMERGLVTL